MVTNAAGNVTVCIVPNSCIFGAGSGIISRLPFLIVSGDSDLPYKNPYYSSPNGPFQPQTANIMTYAVDACMVDFVETESPLNIKGKLEISFFY